MKKNNQFELGMRSETGEIYLLTMTCPGFCTIFKLEVNPILKCFVSTETAES